MTARRNRRVIGTGETERLLQARLPAHLVKAVRMLALEQDLTLKELLTRLVADYVAQHRRPSGGRG